MDTISGYVNKIVYHNEENGYCVVEIFGGGEEKTLVGILPSLEEGEYIKAECTVKRHPLYGDQYQVETYEIQAPEDTLSMERYLASGAIKGIGAALAADRENIRRRHVPDHGRRAGTSGGSKRNQFPHGDGAGQPGGRKKRYACRNAVSSKIWYLFKSFCEDFQRIRP